METIFNTTLREKCPYSELFWSAFPACGLNTERYFVSLRIQSECGKMQTRITPNTDTFYAVLFIWSHTFKQYNTLLLNYSTNYNYSFMKLHYTRYAAFCMYLLLTVVLKFYYISSSYNRQSLSFITLCSCHLQ